MNKDDKIVDLLSEILVRHDRFGKTSFHSGKTGKYFDKNTRGAGRREFDELIEMEQLQGKKVVLRKTK